MDLAHEKCWGNSKKDSWRTKLVLAYQSLGVVYGDLSISPSPSIGISRIPGIELVFTDLTSGIPTNFSRFVTNLHAFHRILVFVCVKLVPVPFVPPAERYLMGHVDPASFRSYRCIVRYGYCDVHQDVDSFESELVNQLTDFIRYDWCRPEATSDNHHNDEFQSSRSSGEYRLTVIGNVEGFEEHESVEQVSVSLGFQTVESVADIIEMNSQIKRVRFDVDDDDYDDEHGDSNDVQMREELQDLLDAQQSGTHSYLDTRM
ncbi:hypothetical protein L2E82_18557 [Cichorium intybus]|uniref:Uncharacterized protein n=1 Tax=Cichorium intybus TaxID=13427 RepID=A0ACB9FBA2_CICIN|nr:hypothetical protein L2E82_18557 [Cichorium intybus]